MISRPLLARGKSSIERSRPQSSSHCASGVRKVRSLLKGAFLPSLCRIPIDRRQSDPVPNCGASVVCEPFPSGRNLSREGHSTLEVQSHKRLCTTSSSACKHDCRRLPPRQPHALRPFAKSAPRGLFSTNRKQSIRSLPRGSAHPLFRRVEPHETRNRRTTVPSRRFVVLSANSAQMIGVSVCLADTVRSRRFSRPQRLAPT